MPTARAAEKSEPYPIRIGESLQCEIKKTMDATAQKKPDVMRMSMMLGLPLLRKRFAGQKR